MGQRFGKGEKTDGDSDRSGLYEQSTAAPSAIDRQSPVRFGKLRDMHRRSSEVNSSQGLALSEMEILNTPVVEGADLADSHDQLLVELDLDSNAVQNPVPSKSVQDEEIQPVQAHVESAVEEDVQQSSVRLSEEKLEDSETPSVNMEGLPNSVDQLLVELDLDSDAVQNPVPSKSVRYEEIQPVQAHVESAVEEDVQQSSVRLSEEKLEDSETPSVNMEGLPNSVDQLLVELDLDSDAVQNPVPSKSVRYEEIQPVQAHVESAVEEDVQQSSVRLSEEKLEDSETPSVNMEEINSCMYAVGEILAASACGAVYAGTREQDGLKPGHREPLPREVALQMRACDDGNIPVIVQLLDWQEHPDRYVMVLERPSPCEGLNKFLESRGGKLDEELAKRIMWQTSVAANICCERGVFHRNITLENLIIGTDTMDVKLINFGCGELLKKSTYNTFKGTREYVCPEFFKTGKYHGKPATVYQLGVLLFVMLCGRFPNSNDRFFINERAWIQHGLTEVCCHLVEDCLQEDPEKRIDLDSIYEHEWFQEDSSDDLQYPFDTGSHDQSRVRAMEINGCQYEIGRKLGQGGFGTVFEGTRLQDILKVAVKFVRKSAFVKDDYISIPGYTRPFPREVGLHMLACEGEFVPVIVQLLDWQETPKHFIMVLERPSPCMDVAYFVKQHRDTVTEKIAQRTRSYACPESIREGKYHGKPATVYSLGVLLYNMLRGKCPALRDLFMINEGTWSKEGLSQGCCQFVIDCLQEDPDNRMDLERVRYHKWFQDQDPANDIQTSVPSGKQDVVQFPDDSGSNFNGHVDILVLHRSQLHTSGSQLHTLGIQLHTLDSPSHTSYSQSAEKWEDDEESSMVVLEINGCQYEIGRKLGQGGFGTVYEATRVQDGLKPGYPRPFPREVGLHLLARKGDNVPVIVQLLDWQDYPEQYVMVLELPSPCKDVGAYIQQNGGTVTEFIAQIILRQVAEAAQAQRNTLALNMLKRARTMASKQQCIRWAYCCLLWYVENFPAVRTSNKSTIRNGEKTA
ncbi:Serine/threonine-protein kinase pim-3 [Triplophysa tibetana]|uniref:non-specific serine/threonine protein kinase n=1 Tax=Triplophysa tibetana TaxID=1572043 RepID=A0A5A9PQ30_9TELE|nr:Serine/threonine-protein kinase pim-3 [Triplophysa tibetana]